MTKLAKDLQPGDKLIMEDGSVAKVNAVKRGFVRYEGDTATMIEHSRGWSQVPAHSEVTLQC